MTARCPLPVWAKQAQLITPTITDLDRWYELFGFLQVSKHLHFGLVSPKGHFYQSLMVCSDSTPWRVTLKPMLVHSFFFFFNSAALN